MTFDDDVAAGPIDAATAVWPSRVDVVLRFGDAFG